MVTTTYPIHDRDGHVIGHCSSAADAMHFEAYERSVEVRVVNPIGDHFPTCVRRAALAFTR